MSAIRWLKDEEDRLNIRIGLALQRAQTEQPDATHNVTPSRMEAYRIDLERQAIRTVLGILHERGPEASAEPSPGKPSPTP
jgi:hypothetical protein